MLSYLRVSVENSEVPCCIMFGVCVIGVVLAYATEENGFLFDLNAKKKLKEAGVRQGLIESWGNENPESPVFSPLTKNTQNESMKNLPTTMILAFYTIYRIIGEYYLRFKRKIDLYYSAYALKRISTSKRHFFYLLEKKVLGLKCVKGESEITSYLDCKRYIGKNWPFMWVVSDVSQPTIECDGYECIPMSSYSYLDLLRNEEVQNAAIDAARKWSTGCHGPRMLGGNMKILRDLERTVADFFGRDDTLLCATGYLATMSAVSAVSSESTVIFADSRIHASLRAGLKIGEGKYFFFKHNNFEDCERIIKAKRSKFANAWMVIESVYSMDGDICDLPAAHRLCKKYNIKLIIDEAHGLGVLGPTGRGAEELFGLPNVATLIVGTFSKSIACIGGYITGPQEYIDYFDFHAQGNVFSACLPAYCAGGAIKSFELISNNVDLVKKAQYNSRFLRQQLLIGSGSWPKDYPEENKYILEGDENTTVIPVIFKDDIDRVMRIATRLKERGYMCSAVAYPACPLRSPRFRITATAAYTEELIINFVRTLVSVCVEETPSPFVF